MNEIQRHVAHIRLLWSMLRRNGHAAEREHFRRVDALDRAREIRWRNIRGG